LLIPSSYGRAISHPKVVEKKRPALYFEYRPPGKGNPVGIEKSIRFILYQGLSNKPEFSFLDNPMWKEGLKNRPKKQG
jgi:hypothetical protein